MKALQCIRITYRKSWLCNIHGALMSYYNATAVFLPMSGAIREKLVLFKKEGLTSSIG